MPSIKEKQKDILWKLKLTEIDASVARRNVSEELSEKQFYNDDEIGFIHQENKSCIKIEDDGGINLFSSNVTGIRVDEKEESVGLFASKVSIISRDLNMYTSPTGLSWNGFYFNPTLYSKIGYGKKYEDKDIRVRTVFKRWDSEEGEYVDVYSDVPFYVRKPVKTVYNEDINDLLRDINISI